MWPASLCFKCHVLCGVSYTYIFVCVYADYLCTNLLTSVSIVLVRLQPSRRRPPALLTHLLSLSKSRCLYRGGALINCSLAACGLPRTCTLCGPCGKCSLKSTKVTRVLIWWLHCWPDHYDELVHCHTSACVYRKTPGTADIPAALLLHMPSSSCTVHVNSASHSSPDAQDMVAATRCMLTGL